MGRARFDDTPVNGETRKGATSNWAYDHNADVTKHRPVFVDRGDPTAVDLNHNSMNRNTQWQDWDISSIVPSGAIAVLLRVDITSTDAGRYLGFRKNGISNFINCSLVFAQVANVRFGADLVVALDANRIIEYIANGTEITSIAIYIRGWWI
jgi:hypothetical protein